MRLTVLAAVLVAVAAGCGGNTVVKYHGSTLPATTAANFTLHDQNGRTISLDAERGHYVIVTFLYTHCPDVCPIIAGNLNNTLKSDVARKAGVQVLAVSVDPKGDTPAAVSKYVHERGLLSSFHYLTGTRAELRQVWTAYHLAPVAGKNGTVGHSTFELLIDPSGQERLVYGAAVKAEEIESDLTQLTQ